jgi:4-hydroxybenzoate polyprenyltransferase
MATEQLINNARPPLIDPLHIFVFGSTLIVYNTPRIVRKRQGRPQRQQQYRPWYFFFFFIGLALGAIAAMKLNTEVLVASGLLSVFAFAYFLPLLPFKNRKRLRDIGLLKIVVLTGVWTTATGILPIIYHHKNIADYPYELLLRFVLVFALCVAFDIRDMHADRLSNIHTLPNKMGSKNSYRLIYISLMVFVALSVLQYLRYPHWGRLLGAILTAWMTWVVVNYTKKESTDRAYLLLVDGIMILYALLVLVY